EISRKQFPFLYPAVAASVLAASTQSEIKVVAETDVSLPCKHQLGHLDSRTLDIEWLLQGADQSQKVVISYTGGLVYDNFNDNQKGRVSFASDYLTGDASLRISALKIRDSGQYTCKVKNGGQYFWNPISLIVLVKPSKPRCWLEGKLLEGNDVTLGCGSADGTDPITYKWERVPKNGNSQSYLPPQSRIDLHHPEIVILRNLTMDSTGTYQCTASNEAGQDSCIIQVTIHYVRGVGVVAGIVVGVVFGVLCVLLIVWLVLRKKEKRKYEEEETPNEIREDAEAPKAKLMKPNSSTSSRSGSSRSGASSTQSIVHNRAARSQRPRPAATLKENGEPPTYSQVVSKEPEPEPDTGKVSDATLARMGATPVMIPAQSRAFQTV
ncbi:CXADR-like membrane protein, partial [Polyodon spathula]|uniref:CXADR-like membrane protein n=1 Tax=Polyodon spathula TaxID=7913 RepID=UPI001B7EFC16